MVDYAPAEAERTSPALTVVTRLAAAAFLVAAAVMTQLSIDLGVWEYLVDFWEWQRGPELAWVWLSMTLVPALIGVLGLIVGNRPTARGVILVGGPLICGIAVVPWLRSIWFAVEDPATLLASERIAQESGQLELWQSQAAVALLLLGAVAVAVAQVVSRSSAKPSVPTLVVGLAAAVAASTGTLFLALTRDAPIFLGPGLPLPHSVTTLAAWLSALLLVGLVVIVLINRSAESAVAGMLLLATLCGLEVAVFVRAADVKAGELSDLALTNQVAYVLYALAAVAALATAVMAVATRQQQPTGPSSSPAGPPRTSNLAVVSLVLGLLYLCGIGAVLAIVFGHQARNEMARDPNVSGAGLAVAGIVLGWIGVASTVLLGLLFAIVALAA